MVSPIKKRKSPKRKKVVIDYPEVPTRKWIPPDARKKVIHKPPQLQYKKPDGMDQNLAVSSLKKMWHYFEMHGDRATLAGNFSQNSIKFPIKTRGFQAPANVVVALSFSQLYKMERWKMHYVDNILVIGTGLYVMSRKNSRNPHKEQISLSEVYKTFYIGNEKVTLDIRRDAAVRGSAKLTNIEGFGNAVHAIFEKEYSCVLVYHRKYYALWKQSRGYYLFDPYECHKEGEPWTGLPHEGFACLTKVASLGVIVNHIISCSLAANQPKGEYCLTPVYIQRVVLINTKYPDCMKAANLEIKPPAGQDIIQQDGKQRKRSEDVPPETEDKNVEDDEESVEEVETAVNELDVAMVDDGANQTAEEPVPPPEKEVPKEKEKKTKLPQRREVEEISYYLDVVPNRMTILRAPTHQCNPNFSKYLGKQSFANAFSAIAMLHIFKSKLWTTRTMEDILKNAEQIHHDSLKTITGDQNLKVTDVCRKITCAGLDFTPKVNEYSAVGRLNSEKEGVSDLTVALREVLSDDDACIITGPLILSFWSLEDQYYMWDPNERDERGVRIAKEQQVGSFTRRCNSAPGMGCITCFRQLKDLVQMYMTNVPRISRRDQFILSKVEMEDYNDDPADWYNFKALRPDKWILCGSFNQSDVRFPNSLRNTQCTSMAAMFLAYVNLTNVKEWTTSQIDEILMSGNDYYGICIRTLKESGKFANRLLMAAELLPQFVIGNKKLIMTLEELYVYGTLSRVKDVGFGFTFKEGLKRFFDENDYGILTCCSLSIAIFKFEDGFFVADSHSRNERGYVTAFGTAVVIRHVTTDEMANSLETNYSGSSDPTYNIHRVSYEIWDANDDGIVKPPVNNYTGINDFVAILRSTISQDCPTKFPLTFGKQQMPMSVAAMGMIKLTPPALWTVDILDETLNVGNKYYKRCIEEFYKLKQKEIDEEGMDNKSPEGGDEAIAQADAGNKAAATVDLNAAIVGVEDGGEGEEATTSQATSVEEQEIDAITTNNALLDFTIGINKFLLNFDEAETGPIVDLPYGIREFFQAPDLEEDDQHELLIESIPLTVALWRDNGLYYYFDPKPRDEGGQVYGKDEWTLLPPEEMDKWSQKRHDDETDNQGGEGDAGDASEPVEKTTEGFVTDTDNEGEMTGDSEGIEMPDDTIAAYVTGADMEGEGEFDNLSPIEEEIPLPPKHTMSYWKRREIDGTSCVMWFADLENLIQHVIENVPPRQRYRMFRATRIKMQNVIVTKDVYDPEAGPKETKVDGDWHNFKEISHGHWILRGTSNLNEIIFPIANRGRQYVTISFVAAAFARLFALSKFENKTIDEILKYGDKLYTSTRRVQRAALEGLKGAETTGTSLTRDEIDAILNTEQIDVTIAVNKFCIGDNCVTITPTVNFLQGELFQDNPDIMTLERALQAFFDSSCVYAVLQTKGIHLFITKYHGAYFLFDPDCRGPSAHKSTSGDACFSRHLELDIMSMLIASNLPVEGSNVFYIHALEMTVEPCERIVKIEEIPPTAPVKISGFHTVVPGKYIVSGTISVESEKYKKLDNQQIAPVSFVALAMTLIHLCTTWTKTTVDEIVRIGSEMYKDLLNQDEVMGFNIWEQKMSVEVAPTEFKIGSIQVNCERRNNDQRGIVDIKSTRVQNLRQGLDLFFNENTHGIISTFDLVVAIWKPEGQNKIYMFDGARRGMAGMPSPDGAACLIVFDTSKLLADHCIAMTPATGRANPYTIVPVEIVVAKGGKRRRTKRAAEAKQEKEILKQYRRKEEEQLMQKGRREYYQLLGTKVFILRGERSENSKNYSENSRGNQDLTNCVASYVMEKMLPLHKWTYRIIHNILDIGDQLYKDSVVMYNPTDRKLGLEALQRNFVMASCAIKLAVGKPIMANNFSVENAKRSLEVFFGSRQFCLLNVENYWLGLFLKNTQYYIFDPQDVNMYGNRMDDDRKGEGFAAVLRFDTLDEMTQVMVRNLRCDNAVFFLNIVAVKDVVKLK